MSDADVDGGSDAVHGDVAETQGGVVDVVDDPETGTVGVVWMGGGVDRSFLDSFVEGDAGVTCFGASSVPSSPSSLPPPRFRFGEEELLSDLAGESRRLSLRRLGFLVGSFS